MTVLYYSTDEKNNLTKEWRAVAYLEHLSYFWDRFDENREVIRESLAQAVQIGGHEFTRQWLDMFRTRPEYPEAVEMLIDVTRPLPFSLQ